MYRKSTRTTIREIAKIAGIAKSARIENQHFETQRNRGSGGKALTTDQRGLPGSAENYRNRRESEGES
jgi:hypothetical protein